MIWITLPQILALELLLIPTRVPVQTLHRALLKYADSHPGGIICAAKVHDRRSLAI